MDKNAPMVRTRCRALELITKVLLTIFIKCFTNYETISQISFHLILIIHLWKKYYHHSIVLVLSHVWLSVAPWTVTRQAPLSMEFSSQEHWRVLPGPPPGDFPIQGFERVSLLSPALAGRFFTTSTTILIHEARASERLSDLPDVIQLINDKTGNKP